MAEVVSVERLTKRFGDVTALDDVTFTIEGPGLVGILGPNGAGKTTLLDIIEGLSVASEGSYTLFGESPAPYPRRRVGVVMQNEARLERVTAREYAELFAAIYDVAGGGAATIARAGLSDRAAVPLDKLSGGEAARLWIASAMVHEPELLLLDEPTAALDPANKREVGAVLKEAARHCTVVMTTHDLAEADALCDQLLFLVEGKLRAAGDRDTLIGERSLEDAFFEICAIRMKAGEVT